MIAAALAVGGFFYAMEVELRWREPVKIAAREGVRDVGALESFVSLTKMREEQAACLQAAAKDAHSRAEKLAEALGSKVGEPMQISEAGAPAPEPRPRPMLRARAMSGPDSEPARGVRLRIDIDAGGQQVDRGIRSCKIDDLPRASARQAANIEATVLGERPGLLK